MAEIDADIEAVVDPGQETEIPKPRPRTSKLTATLVVLNFLAVLAMAFLAYMAISKRQEWAKAVLLRDLATAGLPVDEKDLGTNPEAGGQPKYEMDPAYIREIYKARGGTFTDKFMPVNENFKVHVRHSDLDDAILAVHFAGAGKSVATVKAEIDTLRNQLPAEIEEVARQTSEKHKDKSPAEKRNILRKVLFPLCREGWDVVEVEKSIVGKPDAKLDEFMVEAIQRRLLFDILLPMEVFRPTAAVPADEPIKPGSDEKYSQLLVNRAFELDKVSLDELKDQFQKRCSDMLADRHWTYTNMQRDNFEKRRAAAFLELVVSRVEVPGDSSTNDSKKTESQQEPKAQDKDQAGEPEPKQAKELPARLGAFPRYTQRRVEAVCGLRGFTQACEDLALVTEYMEQQTIDAILRDLGTYRYPLTVRLVEPKFFVEGVAFLMGKLKIVPKDQDTFAKTLHENLASKKGMIDNNSVVIDEVKKLLESDGIKLDATVSVQLEGGIESLLSANAIGFLAKHQMQLERIQYQANRMKSQLHTLSEQKKIHDDRAKHLANRIGQEKEAINELLEARVKTRELALKLQEKQQELFLAQAYLRGAIEYNLYLEQRLQDAERGKGGKTP